MKLFEQYLKEINNGRYIDYSDEYFVTYAIRDQDCIIEDVYIVPEKRGSGIGEQIVSSITKKAKEFGCSYLVGTPMEKNDACIGLHIKTGFKLYKEEKGIVYYIKELL